MLQVLDLHAGYGNVRVLRGLSLAVERGSITALVGSNGAGKTTLMRAIVGLLAPSSGRIVFEDRALEGVKASERVNAGISLVPEGRMVFPDLTVEENLRAGAYLRRVRKRHAQLSARMFGMFPRLAQAKSRLAQMLSGGEQQMLALARAFMSEPKLLLLDEPTLGLSPLVAAELFRTIARARADGMTVLMVEQNVRATLDVADYAYVIENGVIAMNGPAHEVASDPRVQAAYFGS